MLWENHRGLKCFGFFKVQTKQFPLDKIEECQKEITDLQNLELEIPDYSISLDSLEAIKISLDEISVLLPFICEK